MRQQIAKCGLMFCLAVLCAQGCCPCNPGYVIGGSWSLHVDNLPPKGPQCYGGGCDGPGGVPGGHASAARKSAVAATSPPLHPVPVAPVHDPTVGPWGQPLVTPEPHLAAEEIGEEPISPSGSGGSSWLFVRSAEPSPPSGPSLADRRRLPVDTSKDVRRR